jgi:hypothetical protein
MFAVSRIARLIGVVALTAIAGAASVAKEVFTRKDFNEPKPPRVRGSSNRRAPQGIGNRHIHRMARKRKNQARHKAHCRRQRGVAALEVVTWAAAVLAVVGIALGLQLEQRRLSKARDHRGASHVRCVDGTWSEVTNSGMATPVLDRTGKTIACPLT